jgi:spore coat protein A
MDPAGMPEVRNVTHLHGAKVAEPDPTSKKQDNDGWPDNFTVPGEEQFAEYPNDQSSRTLWYHDHAIGVTGRNVAAGLVGMYLIRDEYEKSLNLPKGDYEIPLIFQTQGFNGDGSRYYTKDITLEFYGNALAVNGKMWPYLNVEPRKYRFRMVNASNARTLGLTIADFSDLTVPGPPLNQIGSDAGFLQDTVVLDHPHAPDSPLLTLAPAERADVIIDFSKFAKRTLLLENLAPNDAGEAEIRLPQVMVFKVGAAVSQPDKSSLPLHMHRIQRIDADRADLRRQIVINQMLRPDGNTAMVMLNGKMWHDPLTEKPVAGTTETWDIVNTLVDTHPFHIHLVQFQIVDRTPYDVNAYVAAAATNPSVDAFHFVTGPAQPPDANEMGWKDVARVVPGMITRVTMKFPNIAGYYVYHCHILEHEDMDMMRPFEVVAPPR